MTLKKHSWKFALLTVMVALAQSGFAEDLLVDDNGFKQLRIAPGVASAETVLGVLVPLMQHFPSSEEGKPHMTLEMLQKQDQVLFDLVETGFADDSVAGEHHRGVVIKTREGWELIELRVRPICHRGPVTDNGRCP